ncbi:hypothetical protein KR038_005332 [Drosophila bunnanda]|nr:hypothetical protein KR038_005332 [Drosophila bunnanda]
MESVVSDTQSWCFTFTSPIPLDMGGSPAMEDLDETKIPTEMHFTFHPPIPLGLEGSYEEDASPEEANEPKTDGIITEIPELAEAPIELQPSDVCLQGGIGSELEEETVKGEEIKPRLSGKRQQDSPNGRSVRSRSDDTEEDPPVATPKEDDPETPLGMVSKCGQSTPPSVVELPMILPIPSDSEQSELEDTNSN